MLQQVVLNLQGKSKNPALLIGDALDQEVLLKGMEGEVHSKTLRDLCTFRLMLAYIFRDFPTAKALIKQLYVFKTYNPAISLCYLRQVFTGLCAFTLSRQAQKKKSKVKYQTIGKASLYYFKKALKSGAVNAFPLYTLLLAEQSRSKKAYDEAIRVCSRCGLMNFEALANESAALYFFEVGDEDWAMYYMGKAAGLYEDWGAVGKAQALKDTYQLENNNYSTRRPRGTSTLAKKGIFRKSLVLGKLKAVTFTSSLDLFNSSERSSTRSLQCERSEMETRRKSSSLGFNDVFSTAKQKVFGRQLKDKKRESESTMDTLHTSVF
jgi:hypothetical protein